MNKNFFHIFEKIGTIIPVERGRQVGWERIE